MGFAVYVMRLCGWGHAPSRLASSSTWAPGVTSLAVRGDEPYALAAAHEDATSSWLAPAWKMTPARALVGDAIRSWPAVDVGADVPRGGD